MNGDKLLLILFLVSAGIMVLFINFNGIFVDEEYYISVGRTLFHEKVMIGDPLNDMFGFYIGPALFFIGNIFGGLIGARLVSTIFAAGTLVIIFLIAEKLFHDRKTSLIAFAISLIFGPLFFVGRFATPDAMSVFFSSCAILLAITALDKNHEKSSVRMFFSAVLLFLAFLSKYTAIFITVPIVLLLTLKEKRKSLYFTATFIVLIGIYITIFISNLQALLMSQFVKQVGFEPGILLIFVILIPYLLFFISSKNKQYFIFFLSGVAILVLIQVNLTNAVNTFKHLAYAMPLLAPIAADGIRSGASKKAGKIILIVTMISLFLISTIAADRFYLNEEKASKVLDSIAENSDFILVEGSAYRYYSKKLDFNHVITNFYFDYDKDGNSEQLDYKMAINDGFFRAVMTTTIKSNIDLEELVTNGSNGPYRLYYEENQTLTLGTASLRIYAREIPNL